MSLIRAPAGLVASVEARGSRQADSPVTARVTIDRGGPNRRKLDLDGEQALDAKEIDRLQSYLRTATRQDLEKLFGPIKDAESTHAAAVALEAEAPRPPSALAGFFLFSRFVGPFGLSEWGASLKVSLWVLGVSSVVCGLVRDRRAGEGYLESFLKGVVGLDELRMVIDGIRNSSPELQLVAEASAELKQTLEDTKAKLTNIAKGVTA
jgi:hypothetical protein